MSFTARWNPGIEKLTAKAAAEGLTLGMMVIQGQSMNNTPVDTGNLKASQKVIPATMDSLTATLTTDVPYAIFVHEILTNNHPVGKAKFMEDAVASESERAMALLAATIAKAL